MAEKKTKKSKEKKKTSKTKEKKSKEKKTKAKTKTTKSKNESLGDMGIVIVDDDLSIDKEKEIEERRAYLEEARSQDALD